MISARDPHRPHSRIEIIILSLNDDEPAILLQGIVCWTGKAPDSGDGDKSLFGGYSVQRNLRAAGSSPCRIHEDPCAGSIAKKIKHISFPYN